MLPYYNNKHNKVLLCLTVLHCIFVYISRLDMCQWSPSRPYGIIPGEWNLGVHGIRSWRYQSQYGCLGEQNYSFLFGNLTPIARMSSPLPSHYPAYSGTLTPQMLTDHSRMWHSSNNERAVCKRLGDRTALHCCLSLPSEIQIMGSTVRSLGWSHRRWQTVPSYVMGTAWLRHDQLQVHLKSACCSRRSSVFWNKINSVSPCGCFTFYICAKNFVTWDRFQWTRVCFQLSNWTCTCHYRSKCLSGGFICCQP